MPKKMSGKTSAQLRQILSVSATVIIGAQINMNLFNSDFKISIGILVFSAALILLGKYPVLPVTFFAAFGVFISRILVHWLRFGSLKFVSFLPEMVFYLVYGFLFFLYCRKTNFTIKVSLLPVLFLFDYLSNLAELTLRSSVTPFIWNSQLGILLVALSRSLAIWFILSCLRHYKFALLKAEHAERYQRLLLLISRLNGEVVLMQKNKQMIEETMNTSYKLFQQMQDAQVDETLSREALSVAKDVHEIKKEYALILRGLSEAMDLNLNDEGMYLSDILQILKKNLTGALPDEKHLHFDIQLQENLYTEKHYFLMSVLRNLFNNAVEAAQNPEIHLSITQISHDDDYLFQVTDNGPGILPEDLEQIFSPGFSTKINYETGEINRGLGLNLVQDLIENQWHGTISVSSCPGNTVFTICIPKKEWGGETV